MTIHAIIFVWNQWLPQAHKIAAYLWGRVDKLDMVLSYDSTIDHADWNHWIGSDAYFGAQWNKALELFRESQCDVLFHHQADGLLRGCGRYDSYARLVDEMHAMEGAGVYAPSVDYTAWYTAGNGKCLVFNTDCTAWAIHRQVIESMPERVNHRYGWGIDIAICEKARQMGMPVVRDHGYLVDHPRFTGYENAKAREEAECYLRGLGEDGILDLSLLPEWLRAKLD